VSNFNEYLNLDGINWSSLKLIHESPLAYRYWQDHPRGDKPAYALGRAAHVAILEPERFAKDVVVFDGRRAGKVWKEFQEENDGAEIVKPAEMAQIKAMVDAVHNHPVAMSALECGTMETNMEWTDPVTGLACKGRADCITDRVVDLKTAREVNRRQFTRAAADYLYHGQTSFYHDGYGHMMNEQGGGASAIPPLIIAVQSTPPYDVAVYEIGADALEAGRNLYRGLLDTLKACQDADYWPGCEVDAVEMELPPWAAGVEEEVLNDDGMDWSTVATTPEA